MYAPFYNRPKLTRWQRFVYNITPYWWDSFWSRTGNIALLISIIALLLVILHILYGK